MWKIGLMLGLAASPAAADQPVYDGSRGDLLVDAPRLEEARITVDGRLDEPAWTRAARLTGFTQYEPAEGAAATERTEVLLFYTPTALHVGIRAHARNPERIRSTLARRDRIGQDDHVEILLDTFLDRRRAFTLAVNPLGIQQDGIRTESLQGRGTDLSQDFIFDSRGRITPEGYEVELRIPFKSLKFQAADPQRWGLQVIRHIAASGGEESWAPISRANPSTLAQSGTLANIRELRPGRLFELNPTATAKRVGGLDDEGRFRRGGFEPDAGLNAKYGVTPNLTLDATVNPDFSQVEADAGQIAVNERFSLYFPERRPFFLEGARIFETPEQLVYTRTIADPIGGLKLTGKAGRYSIGYLGAVDDAPMRPRGSPFVPDPSRTLVNIARVQRDMGAGSNVGLLVTDRTSGDEFNRVGSVDGQLRFGGVYTWGMQAAGSWTRAWSPHPAGTDLVPVGSDTVSVRNRSTTGHLFQSYLDRTGRRSGFILKVMDVPRSFRTESGFIRRTGITELFGAGRVSYFGAPGARVERWDLRGSNQLLYTARGFWNGVAAEEGSTALRTSLSLRGQHRVEAWAASSFYVLDPGDYSGLIAHVDGAFRTGAELLGPELELRGLRGTGLEVESSHWKALSWELEGAWRETPIFAEGTRGHELSGRAALEIRPSEALRMEASVRRSTIRRSRDGSVYSEATLPRLRLEYQISRSIFVRAVGQYSVEEVDFLRTPEGAPYLHAGVPYRLRRGARLAPGATQPNPLRTDLLFSYQPSPGTLLFVGYGREAEDDGAYRFGELRTQADGVFVKVSYLLRR